MKTDVIEVRDMLSVLSVEGVEARIKEVSGVESATVNYDAGTATIRYDETRLKTAEIKPAVHQAGYQSEDGSKNKQDTAKTLKDSPSAPSSTSSGNAPKDDASATTPPRDIVGPEAIANNRQPDKPPMSMPKTNAAPTDAKTGASPSTASDPKDDAPIK
jgi:Cu2+-exporting ATPase